MDKEINKILYMDLRLNRLFSFKTFILKMALTASAISGTFTTQSNDKSNSASSTMVRTRRKFGEIEAGDVLTAVRLSKSVYFWEDDKDKFNTLQTNHDSAFDTFYSIVEENGKIFVGFRGTDNVKNILLNLWCNWSRDEKSGIFCHNGMMKAYLSIHEALTLKLKNIAMQKNINFQSFLNENVIFSGHSLGGALALLATHYFLKESNSQIKTVCFATPTVMDALTASNLNTVMKDKILNFQQDYDPIPHILNGWDMFVEKTTDFWNGQINSLSQMLPVLEDHFNSLSNILSVMKFLSHPGSHVGLSVQLPHIGGYSTFKNIHGIKNYVNAILSYVDEKIEHTEQYFTTKEPSINKGTYWKCQFRQKIHHIAADLPTLLTSIPGQVASKLKL
jgi:hypothetical protein